MEVIAKTNQIFTAGAKDKAATIETLSPLVNSSGCIYIRQGVGSLAYTLALIDPPGILATWEADEFESSSHKRGGRTNNERMSIAFNALVNAAAEHIKYSRKPNPAKIEADITDYGLQLITQLKEITNRMIEGRTQLPTPYKCYDGKLYQELVGFIRALAQFDSIYHSYVIQDGDGYGGTVLPPSFILGKFNEIYWVWPETGSARELFPELRALADNISLILDENDSWKEKLGKALAVYPNVAGGSSISVGKHELYRIAGNAYECGDATLFTYFKTPDPVYANHDAWHEWKYLVDESDVLYPILNPVIYSLADGAELIMRTLPKAITYAEEPFDHGSVALFANYVRLFMNEKQADWSKFYRFDFLPLACLTNFFARLDPIGLYDLGTSSGKDGLPRIYCPHYIADSAHEDTGVIIKIQVTGKPPDEMTDEELENYYPTIEASTVVTISNYGSNFIVRDPGLANQMMWKYEEYEQANVAGEFYMRFDRDITSMDAFLATVQSSITQSSPLDYVKKKWNLDEVYMTTETVSGSNNEDIEGVQIYCFHCNLRGLLQAQTTSSEPISPEYKTALWQAVRSGGSDAYTDIYINAIQPTTVESKNLNMKGYDYFPDTSTDSADTAPTYSNGCLNVMGRGTWWAQGAAIQNVNLLYKSKPKKVNPDSDDDINAVASGITTSLQDDMETSFLPAMTTRELSKTPEQLNQLIGFSKVNDRIEAIKKAVKEATKDTIVTYVSDFQKWESNWWFYVAVAANTSGIYEAGDLIHMDATTLWGQGADFKPIGQFLLTQGSTKYFYPAGTKSYRRPTFINQIRSRFMFGMVDNLTKKVTGTETPLKYEASVNLNAYIKSFDQDWKSIHIKK